MTEDQYDGIIKHLQDVRAGMELVFEEISNVSRRIGLMLDPAGDTAVPAKKNGQVPKMQVTLEPVAVALAAPPPPTETVVPSFVGKRYSDFTKAEMAAYQREYYRCVTKPARLGLPRIESPWLIRPPVDFTALAKAASKASVKARVDRAERDLIQARKVMERAAQGLVTPFQASKAAAILSKHRQKMGASTQASK